MILAFLAKEWKGLLAGGSVVLVLALMALGSMYSVITVQSGTIRGLKSDKTSLKTDVETCKKLRDQDKITCEDVARLSKEQQDETMEWMVKHEESRRRFVEYTRLAEKRDAEALRDSSIKEQQTANAISEAASIEGKIQAFAASVLGAAIE